jgi:hypothetical protein
MAIVDKILLFVGPIAGVAALSGAILVGNARGDSASEVTFPPGNPATSTVPSRLPVPDSPAQQKALQEVKAVLKDEFARATDVKGQVALGHNLARLAAEGGDGPAVRYAMASQALELAVNCGEVSLASDLVEELVSWYDIDGWELRSKTLSELTHSVRTANARDRLAKESLELMEMALAEERYEVAMELAGRGSKLAAASKDPALRDRGREAVGRAKWLQEGAEEVNLAIDRLMQQPDDPEASLIIGKFRCFAKEDWQIGLPFLAKGSDETLKELARQELLGPTLPSDQVRLADGWWELAGAGEKRSDPTAKPMRLRAIHWYRQALPKLAGLTLVKAQRRTGEDEGAGTKARSGANTRLKPEQN